MRIWNNGTPRHPMWELESTWLQGIWVPGQWWLRLGDYGRPGLFVKDTTRGTQYPSEAGQGWRLGRWRIMRMGANWGR